MENRDNMHKQMEDFSTEMETVREPKQKTINLKIHVSDMKNSFNGLIN